MSVPDWMIDTPSPNVEDMAAVIRRLVHSLRKAAPDNEVATRAMAYLKKHGLEGSPLRAAPASPAPHEGAKPVAFMKPGGDVYSMHDCGGVIDPDHTPLYAAPQEHEARDAARLEPQWIVNDLGELGVQVGGRFFFLYKGGNIEYSGRHDDGTPMRWRMVGKREFGEVQYPEAWLRAGRTEDRYTVELTYHPGLSFGQPEDGEWRDLPVIDAARAVKGDRT